MRASEVLSKARDVLADRGWVQGVGKSEYGLCAIGALTYGAAPDGTLATYDEGAFHAAKGFLASVNSGFIVSWNDAPERTYEDVQIALKQAEELALEAEDAA